MRGMITSALLATAVMVGAGPVDAQERESASWWAPAVLSLVQAVDGERPRWTRTGDARTQDPRRDEDRTRSDRETRDSRWPARTETRRDRDDDRRYESRGQKGREGKGPPFCRNGQGHPVHGQQWCRDKGFGGYDRYDARRPESGRDRRDGGWTRSGWEDVIMRGPTTSRDRRIAQPDLMDILGGAVMGRLVDHGRSAGLGGAMDARWVPTDLGSVLQLRMGGHPLAELTDTDRDGRADVVLLTR